jgi:hypothetical protein
MLNSYDSAVPRNLQSIVCWGGEKNIVLLDVNIYNFNNIWSAGGTKRTNDEIKLWA